MSALKVAFEGLPGSGKTTAIEGVAEELQQHDLKVDVFDIETTGYAPELRQLTKEFPMGHPSRIMLFWILRLQQYEYMHRADNEADVIMADRFWGSTLVYDGYGNQVPIEVLSWVSEGVKVQPDITLFFDAPLEVVLARKNATTLRDPVFAQRVANGYQELANRYDWVRVDATQETQMVRAEVVNNILGSLALNG